MTLRSLKYQHLSELKGSIGRLDVQCLSGNVSSPCRCSSSHVSVFSSRSFRGRDSWAGKYQSGVHTALGSIQMDHPDGGSVARPQIAVRIPRIAGHFRGGRLGGTGRAATGGYSERHLFAMSQQKLIVQRKAV
jgi:hypothetical protein